MSPENVTTITPIMSSRRLRSRRCRRKLEQLGESASSEMIDQRLGNRNSEHERNRARRRVALGQHNANQMRPLFLSHQRRSTSLCDDDEIFAEKTVEISRGGCVLERIELDHRAAVGSNDARRASVHPLRVHHLAPKRRRHLVDGVGSDTGLAARRRTTTARACLLTRHRWASVTRRAFARGDVALVRRETDRLVLVNHRDRRLGVSRDNSCLSWRRTIRNDHSRNGDRRSHRRPNGRHHVDDTTLFLNLLRRRRTPLEDAVRRCGRVRRVLGGAHLTNARKNN